MKPTSLVAVAALGLAATPLAAQQTPAPTGQERIHVVRPGETLWDIARTYLSDPFLWPEIFRLNTAVVENPARIYPQEQLVLPDGVRRVAQTATGGDDRTVFFPTQRSPRESGITIRRAGTADIPVVTEGDFYGASVLARESEIGPVGQIAEVQSASVVPFELAPQVHPYDRVYVPLNGAGDAVRVGDRLHFVRREDEVRGFGRLFRSTGLGTVAALDGNVATVVVTRLYDRADVGDYAVPAARFPVRAGVSPARAADDAVAGRVVGFQRNSVVQAIESVAFLNVGRADGVREGDEFEAYVAETRRDWGTRPGMRVATMQVVRVTDRTASVRITGLDQPAMAAGLPVRRVARMP